MNKYMNIIYCTNHVQEVIAKCLTCKSMLCLDCIFEHQSTGHQYKRLTMISDQYIQTLQANIEDLNNKLKQIKKKEANGHCNNLMEQGVQIIEMCKLEIQELIEKHFEELKQQFCLVMQTISNQNSYKNLKQYTVQKMQGYQTLINEIRKSIYKITEFEESDMNQDIEMTRQVILKKCSQLSAQTDTQIQFPKLAYHQQALIRFQQYLTQILGFKLEKSSVSPRKHIKSENKLKQLRSVHYFVEGAQTMFAYHIKQKKAVKTNFRDYIVPTKCKVVATQSGRVYVVGGQRIQASDKSVKYHREICQLDKKYQMMKVATLMKEGKIFHTVVAVCQNQKNQVLYILGGRNTQRLNAFQKYEISKNQIVNLTPFKKAVGGASGIELKNKLYYFGGFLNEDQNNGILIFDISENNWQEMIPINSINYLSCIEPVLLLNKDQITILGGCRKEKQRTYAVQAIQNYNVSYNFLNLTEQFLPIGVFKSQNSEFYEGNYYISLQSKRDCMNYGPNYPSLLVIDLSKNRYTIQTFMQL